MVAEQFGTEPLSAISSVDCESEPRNDRIKLSGTERPNGIDATVPFRCCSARSEKPIEIAWSTKRNKTSEELKPEDRRLQISISTHAGNHWLEYRVLLQAAMLFAFRIGVD